MPFLIKKQPSRQRYSYLQATVQLLQKYAATPTNSWVWFLKLDDCDPNTDPPPKKRKKKESAIVCF